MQGADALERATRVKIVIFDKTGTLTKGKPTVTDTHIFQKGESLLACLKLALDLNRKLSSCGSTGRIEPYALRELL